MTQPFNMSGVASKFGSFFDGNITAAPAAPAKLPDGTAIRSEEGLGLTPGLRRFGRQASDANAVQLGHDTTPGIFAERFACKIPFWATYTDEHIRDVGMLSTGDKKHDRQMHNQLVQVMLTINEMVEHYRHGRPVVISGEADIEKIYANIQAHLNSWRHHLAASFNAATAPVDDLLLLNDFSLLVYNHVRKEVVTRMRRDIITGLDEGGWLNIKDVMAGKTAPKSLQEKISTIDTEMKKSEERHNQFQKDLLTITRNLGQWDTNA